MTADPLTVVFDGIAESIDHAASMVGRAIDGSYGLSDAIEDLAACSVRATKLGFVALSGLASALSPTETEPNPTRVDREIELSLTREAAPLTLATTGLRAIGRGPDIRIHPAAITFTPKQVVGGAPEPVPVTVTVSFLAVEPEDQKCTLVYEGDVVDDADPDKVVGTIRVPKPAH